MACRLMVGPKILVLVIGVRVPTGQPFICETLSRALRLWSALNSAYAEFFYVIHKNMPLPVENCSRIKSYLGRLTLLFSLFPTPARSNHFCRVASSLCAAAISARRFAVAGSGINS